MTLVDDDNTESIPLWELSRNMLLDGIDPWLHLTQCAGYVTEFVIAAATAKDARAMAGGRAGAEGFAAWTNERTSHCFPLGNANGRYKRPAVIVRGLWGPG